MKNHHKFDLIAVLCLFKILFILRVHTYSKWSKVKEAHHWGKPVYPSFVSKTIVDIETLICWYDKNMPNGIRQ